MGERGCGCEARFGYVIRRSCFKTFALPNHETGIVTDKRISMIMILIWKYSLSG